MNTGWPNIDSQHTRYTRTLLVLHRDCYLGRVQVKAQLEPGPAAQRGRRILGRQPPRAVQLRAGLHREPAEVQGLRGLEEGGDPLHGGGGVVDVAGRQHDCQVGVGAAILGALHPCHLQGAVAGGLASGIHLRP